MKICPPAGGRPRRVAHLDMDAFFASVTLLQYPQLQSLPVVIGGERLTPEALVARINALHPDAGCQADALHAIRPEHFPRLANYRGRGVSTTATYAARRFGLSSGMGLTRSAHLCPDAILLPPDLDLYRKFSHAFKSIVRSVTPIVEDRGIDEIFIDVTDIPGVEDDGGRDLAERIQRMIREGTGLHCSIGVAPNRLLAKIASDLNKPQGITILFPQDVQTRIWPLPCRYINGIGPKTDARLQSLSIERIGQLAACDPACLMDHFGLRHGQWLHEAAWGRDNSPVTSRSTPVTISCETTFARDLHARHDRAELSTIFSRLAEQAALALQNKGYAGRTVGIKLRYADFRTVSREQTFSTATQDVTQIRQRAGMCLKRVDLSRRFRLLGIRVSALECYDDDPHHAPAREPMPESLQGTLPL